MINRVARNELETTVETAVATDAKNELGVLSWKLTLRYDAGWPDRLFLIPGGIPFLIEFKAPGEKPEGLQTHRIAVLRALGYDVEVHDDYTEAMAAINRRLR